MSVVIFLFFFVPISLFAASRMGAKEDRQFLFVSVICAWIFFVPLVALVNQWMPFSGGGDDEDYYQLAGLSIEHLDDVLALNRFASVMEQPGYPWLLSLLHTLVGNDLLAYKFLNLFFLILLALTWYRIGFILESRHFARKMVLVILLLTPLWYYIFFLLKDMSITLLQSFFLLATVELCTVPRGRQIVAAVLSTFFLLLFRTPLVVQNGLVLIGALMGKIFARDMRHKRWMLTFLGILFLGVVGLATTSPDFMRIFGIYSDHRLIGSRAMLEHGYDVYARSEMNRILFPVLYLCSETSGLSPKTWSELDSHWLRGTLALPWIFLLIPFAVLALPWLFSPTDRIPERGIVARLQQSRAVVTPWSSVVLFVLASMGISWIVGDSTRWRIPDMPMIAAISMAGWHHASPRIRQQILSLWIGSLIILFSLFHILRG